ncbi:MAG: zinc ribbon domain-containing protein [Agathobacter sp.]
MSSVVSVGVLVVLTLCLVIAALLLGFVYHDAKKRNMNALLWSLLAVFTPFFLGLIVYLICRNPVSDLQCPRCGAAISTTDKICSNCKSTLLTQCPNCDFPVQRGWKNCPKCGSELPGDFEQPIRAYKKDNNLAVILVIIVLIVLALFLLAVPLLTYSGNFANTSSYTGMNGLYNITAEDMAENEAISAWLKECKNSDKDAYVLLSKNSSTCLVYVPECDTLIESGISITYFDDKECELYIYIDDTTFENKYDYDFFLYEFDVFDNTTVEVIRNGSKCNISVTATEADISLDSWGGQ